MSMSWEMDYERSLKEADEALQCVKSRMRVYIQPGCAEPETLVEALIRRAPRSVRCGNRPHDDHGVRPLRGARNGRPLSP
jgi:acyl-CoA hydrolase